jgi:hypothetical protein
VRKSSSLLTPEGREEWFKMCLKHIGRSQFESEAAWAWETVQLEQKSWNQCYHIELFT